MKTSRRTISLLSTASLLATASLFGTGGARAATAAEAPFDSLPAQTVAVVKIASLDRFAAGFQELVTSIGPPATMAGPEFAKGLNEAFKIGVDSTAVDRTKPVYAAVFSIEGQPSEPVAWLVQTSDEAKLRRTVLKASADGDLTTEKRPDGFEKVMGGAVWYFGRRGDWVVYTQNEEVVKRLTFDAGQQPALSSLVESRAHDVLNEGDAAVFVNIAQLIELYGAKLDEARDKLRRQIQMLPKEFLDNGLNPEGTKKMYGDAAEVAINAAYDGQWAAGRLSFSASGVSAELLLGVKDETNTSDLIAAYPPTGFDSLGLLPAGAAVYFGYTPYSETLADWRRDWAKAAYGSDSPNAQKLLAAIDTLSQAGVTTKVGSLSLPSGLETAMITTAISQAKDAEKLRAGENAYQPAANDLSTPLFTQSTKLQPAAETYQNHSVDLLTTRFEFKDVTDMGQQIGQKFVQKLFGGNEFQSRLTTVEGLLVEAGGNDAKYLHELIDGLASGEKVLGLDEAYAATRDQLGEQANLVALLNAPKLLVNLLSIVRNIPPYDMFLAQAPINYGAQPAASYAGVSLGTESRAVRVNLFIPSGQPQGVLQIFGQGR